MRKIVIGLLFFPAGLSAFAQTVRTPVASAFIRLHTYNVFHGNAFSFVANQAALASIDHFSAGIYNERKFLLQQLSCYAAAVALPTAAGNFGFRGDYFGDASYHETGLGLAYGRKLTDRIDIGLQFNYYSFSMANYGSASSITAEGGLMVHLTDELNVGLHVYNPTGVPVGKNEEEKLPVILSVGLGYEASRKFFIGAEVEKIEDQAVNVNAGLHYYFDEKLFASAGIASATSSYYLAFGVLLKNNQLNVVASKHPQLGITPGLLLVFNSAKRNRKSGVESRKTGVGSL